MPEQQERSKGGERIAKRLARAGLCSRREAERWIEAGRVMVDGAVIKSPALNVDETNEIRVDGKPLAGPEPVRVWRYYKPTGLVTTNRDPEGRQTVFDNLPVELPRVISIGRLDLTSEGLLLLTNDGDLARELEHPDTGWIRRYRVRAYGKVDEAALASLADGVTVDGVRYGPMEATLDSAPNNNQGHNHWLTVSLREGKNREVRNVLSHLGLTVNRLIRTAYGPFQLGKMHAGAAIEVPRKVLNENLGRAWREKTGKLDKSRPEKPEQEETGQNNAHHRR